MPFAAGSRRLVRLEMPIANLGVMADAEVGGFAILAGIADDVDLIVVMTMKKLEFERITLPPDNLLGDVLIVRADADADG